MAGQSGKAKLWELANYGSIPESLVFRLHYTRLTFAVNSFVPFCSFRSPNQQFWFSDSGADSAPLARAEGADGVSPRPLRRHAAGETLRGAHGPRRRGEHPRDTSSRSRSNPTAHPAKTAFSRHRLSLRTPAPLTTSSSPRPEPASPGPGAGRRRRFGVRDRPVAWHGGVVLQIRAGRPDPTRAARVGGDRWQPQQAHLKRSVGASAMGHPRRRERVQQRRVLPPSRAQRGLRLRLHRRGRRGRCMRTAK